MNNISDFVENIRVSKSNDSDEKNLQLVTTYLLPSIFNIPKQKGLHQSDSQTKDTVFNTDEKYLNHSGIKNILTGLGAVPMCTCKIK